MIFQSSVLFTLNTKKSYLLRKIEKIEVKLEIIKIAYSSISTAERLFSNCFLVCFICSSQIKKNF